MKWAEMKIIKLHKEEQRVVLRKEKPSANGELVAEAVIGCEEPRSKTGPWTERVSGMKLLETKPTSCRAAVPSVLRGYSILLGAAGSRTQPSPSFGDGKGDEKKLERRQERTPGEKRLWKTQCMNKNLICLN